MADPSQGPNEQTAQGGFGTQQQQGQFMMPGFPMQFPMGGFPYGYPALPGAFPPFVPGQFPMGPGQFPGQPGQFPPGQFPMFFNPAMFGGMTPAQFAQMQSMNPQEGVVGPDSFSGSANVASQSDVSSSSTPSQGVASDSFADLGSFGLGSRPAQPSTPAVSQGLGAPSPASNFSYGNPTGAINSIAAVSQPNPVDFGDFTRPTQPTATDDFGDFTTAQPKLVAKAKPPGQNSPAVASAAQKPAPVQDDDFGDFTPAQPKPAAIQDDDFGDFTPSTQKPQPVRATQPVQPIQDSDFGDFTPAAQPMSKPAPPSAPQPIKLAQDDDFGDFTPATQHQPQPTRPADDDFGDFTTTQPRPQSVKPAQDDDFGDFTTSQPQPQSVKPVQDDDFGDFTTSSQPQPGKPAQDDDFGDFTPSATPARDEFGDFPPVTQPQPRTSAHTMPPISRPAQEDDFGDFTPATQTTKVASDKVAPQPDDFGDFTASQSTRAPPGDEDFGDFTPAGGQQTPSQGNNLGNAVPTQVSRGSTSKSSVSIAPQNDDEDFADFTQAPAPTEKHSVVSSAAPMQPAARRRSLDFLDDLVGGELTDAPLELGGVPSASTVLAATPSIPSIVPPVVAQVTANLPATEEDDFGSFNTAEVPAAVKPATATREDDFGEFATAVTQPATSHHINEPDDFGEFPAPSHILPASDIAPTPQSVPPQSLASPMSDDFGDFAEASPVNVPPTSNDTDEFGDFTSPAPVRTIVAPPPVKLASDVSDEFGSFDSAPQNPPQERNLAFMDELVGQDGPGPLSLDNVVSPTSTMSSDPVTQVPNDFGDFASSTFVSPDDFGDFSGSDSASEITKPVTPASAGYTLNVVPPSSISPSAASSASSSSFVPTLTPVEDSMNDFGDFSSLSPAPVSATHDAIEPTHTATLQLPRTSQMESDFGDLSTPSPLTDDFGDFGSVSIASPPKKKADDAEDEFGNFGSANDSAKSSGAPTISGSAAMSSLDDIFNDILGASAEVSIDLPPIQFVASSSSAVSLEAPAAAPFISDFDFDGNFDDNFEMAKPSPEEDKPEREVDLSVQLGSQATHENSGQQNMEDDFGEFSSPAPTATNTTLATSDLSVLPFSSSPKLAPGVVGSARSESLFVRESLSSLPSQPQAVFDMLIKQERLAEALQYEKCLQLPQLQRDLADLLKDAEDDDEAFEKASRLRKEIKSLKEKLAVSPAKAKGDLGLIDGSMLSYQELLQWVETSVGGHKSKEAFLQRFRIPFQDISRNHLAQAVSDQHAANLYARRLGGLLQPEYLAYSAVWGKMVSTVTDKLRRAAAVAKQLKGAQSDPAITEFFLALTAMSEVGSRIQKSYHEYHVNKENNAHLEEVFRDFVAAQSELGSLLGAHKGQQEEQHDQACYLCLDSARQGMTLHNNHWMHAPCGNLFLHLVEPKLP